MTARYTFTACTCRFDSYSARCRRPQHVVWALRELPEPRRPLALSAPCPNTVPEWMTA